MGTPRPTFRELSREECTALLTRHMVGRVALAHQQHVDILPIHFVYDEGWIYGRTAVGTHIEMVSHNRWVAFEIDQVRGLFDWESVVVKGGLYLLRKDGSEHEQQVYAKGVALTRRIIPEALTADDPIPERAILFRIHVDEITGRAAQST